MLTFSKNTPWTVLIMGQSRGYTGFRKKKKGVRNMHTIEITRVKGHVEVYDQNGTFLFSADTEQEARDDLRDWGVV